MNGLQRTLDRLRIVLAPELPDEYLLKKFISSRDEIAFATLVRRHGKMVLGVSRRVLGNLHDSEDVLQATFLVLAQKARLVANRDALASWLYRVAYRISLKARARNDRRRQMEAEVDLMSRSSTASPQVHDWEVVLDEELNRLPEKYRLPIILCDLEGRTRKEVEQQLRLAAGTLSSRLTRARRMLADRLIRRGIILTGAALWTAPQATATLPPALVAATAQQAVLVAAGQFGAISSSVSVLMKAGVKAMFMSKLKATVAAVVVLAVLSAGSLVYSGGGGTEAGQARPPSELEKLRRENELLKVNLRVTLEKIEVLESEVRTLKKRDKKGAATRDELQLQMLLERALQEPADRRSDKQPPAGSKTPPQSAADKEAHWRLSRDEQKALSSALSNAKMPPSSNKDTASWGLRSPEQALQDLDRALSVYRDRADGKERLDENTESLRRVTQSLEVILKQLQELERTRGK
jgi:RNA polymerase sigma factor (sigma-70 family)